MRVAISGSRGPDPSRGRDIGWTDFDLVRSVVHRLLKGGHTINVGDAPSGVDYMVHEVFESDPELENYPSTSLKTYEARWQVEGKRAGHNRNAWMVSESDMLVCLFAPTLPLTPGTLNALTHGKKKDIPVHVYFAPIGWAVLLRGPKEVAPMARIQVD